MEGWVEFNPHDICDCPFNNLHGCDDWWWYRHLIDTYFLGIICPDLEG